MGVTSYLQDEGGDHLPTQPPKVVRWREGKTGTNARVDILSWSLLYAVYLNISCKLLKKDYLFKTELQRGAITEIFQVPIHSPNGQNCQRERRLKPEAWNSVWVSHMGAGT